MVLLTDALQSLAHKIFKIIPQPVPSREALNNVKIIAHRGHWDLNERLENTLEAFRPCLNHNIWGIEFDLRWTKDKVPVIHHDANTSRVFKKNIEISQVHFSELRKELPKIPSLIEVVKELGNKIHFMIELKTNCDPAQRGILKQILSPLEPITDYHLMSLDCQRFSNLDFAPAKAMVTIARTNINKIYENTMQHDFGGFTGQFLLLNNTKLKSCHQKDIRVGTGFPDSKKLLYREANRSVDWVFTNRAIELSKYKNERQPLQG